MSNPCGYDACTVNMISLGDSEERSQCFYPDTNWVRTEVNQVLNLPLCSRLAIHGTSISQVRILPTEGEWIEVKLSGNYLGPEGAVKLAIQATDSLNDTMPCNVVFTGPGYLCEAFASDELYLDVLVPSKHRFETLAITGRSVAVEMPLTATKAIRISSMNAVRAKLSAARVFVAAQRGVDLNLTSCGNAVVDLICTRGDIDLKLTGFTKFSAICSAITTDIDFLGAATGSASPVELKGTIRADTGEISVM